MAEAPWICPRCGTATNVDNCPQCLHERPYAVASYNRPGSYFAFVQGRQGYAGMSRGCALAFILVLAAQLITAVATSWRHR